MRYQGRSLYIMLPHFDKIPDTHKIAVLRANALGDFIFILPALDALRAAYPDAEIVLLGKAWHAAFLAKRPSPVNRVVVVPRYGGVGDDTEIEEEPLEIERFFRYMQREHFDLAFQLHGGGQHSNDFIMRLGARMTLGLRTPDAVPLSRWIPYAYFQQEVVRYLEVVALAGATPTTLEPRLRLTQEDQAEAERVVPERDKPLVALHPGATDPRRRWPPERFAAVGDALAAAGAHVVVTGTQSERAIVEKVVDTMHAKGLNLAQRLSLGGLAGLFARSRVLVSNDTGPLHLASAVGTPTVGIYWCFNLINSGPLTRLHHHPFVSWQLTCPICGINYIQEKCDHQISLVDTIATDEVIAASMNLFTNYASFS